MFAQYWIVFLIFSIGGICLLTSVGLVIKRKSWTWVIASAIPAFICIAIGVICAYYISLPNQ